MKQLLIQLNHFLRASIDQANNVPNGQKLLPMLKAFPKWRQSLDRRPIDEKKPWMSYAAIDFLSSTLCKSWKVFEWGAGGSTIFLASRVNQLISVEHDVDWAEMVRLSMKDRPYSAWNLFVVPPLPRAVIQTVDPSNPLHYASSVEPHCSGSFQNYASLIDQFKDEEFELVIVDGRCRPSCAMHAINKIKRGGYLIFDDCERQCYSWIHAEMKRRDWQFHYFNGPGPCIWEFRHTGCWRKPS